MPSKQNNIVLLILRLNRLLYYRSGELNVETDRNVLDRLGRLFKPLSPIQFQPLRINNIPAEWVTPEDLTTQRVILYLHGGGFNSGSIVSHRSMVGNIASACKARALLIDYRLAPEHPFPCALEDCRAAYDWLRGSGTPVEQITLMGDSAGGALTLALLIQLRDQDIPLPAMAVCLSPATDLTMEGKSWKDNLRKDMMLNPKSIRTSIEIYLRDTDPHDPYVSPLYADLQGLPPILIQVGSYEVLLSDVTRFAEKAKQAGVTVKLEVWEGMQHVWQFAASLLPEARQAIKQIGQFIDDIYANETTAEKLPSNSAI
jgi:epsilon-lactone hydrolase